MVMMMMQAGNNHTSNMNEQAIVTPPAATQEIMWRSKLGTNYPKAFMEQNESRLLKELQTIRDHGDPENRTCADCGVRGTVWASVNLGIFLCMTCGAHHRSLGTHISLPKGCTGTYWWGPDEIEQMKSNGNARAKIVYGDLGPPNGMRKEDSNAWKQYLTDKYVHKKFAPPRPTTMVGGGGVEQRGDEPTTTAFGIPSSPLLSATRTSPRLSQKSSPKFSRTPMPDIDLIHFERNGAGSSPNSPLPRNKTISPRVSVRLTQKMTGNTGDDFFAEFGV